MGKRRFLEWFKHIQMPDQTEWIIVGDFNLIRKLEERNKEGGDVNEKFLFNEAINNLSLIELPHMADTSLGQISSSILFKRD